MLKAFIRDSVVYGVLRFFTSGTTILLLPLYTRFLPPAEYGFVDLVTVFAAIVTTILTLEITQGLARNYAAAASREERSSYTSTAFWFSAITFSFFIVAISFAGGFVSLLIAGTARYRRTIVVALLAIAGQVLLNVVLVTFRYGKKPLHYAMASIAYSGVSVLAALLFVLGLRMGVAGVFFGQVTAAGVGLVVALFLANGEVRFLFDRPKCLELLKFSIPLALSTLALLTASYADRFAVRSLLTIGALGVYAVGARVASAVTLTMAAFQMAMTPLIYNHHADDQAPQQIERIFRWFLVISCALVFFVGIFAADILHVFATSEYGGAAQVVFPLSLAAVLANLYLFAPGLWIERKTTTIAVINVAAALCSFSLNFALVPAFGVRGAALGACLIALLGFWLHMRFAQRLYSVPYQWRRIGMAGLLVVLFAFVGSPLGWVQASEMTVIVKLTSFLAFALGTLIALIGVDEMKTAKSHFHVETMLAAISSIRRSPGSSRTITPGE